MSTSPQVREQILRYQRNEITKYHIYKRLARTIKTPENRRILEKIADDELAHYQQWQSYTQQEVKPDRRSVWV